MWFGHFAITALTRCYFPFFSGSAIAIRVLIPWYMRYFQRTSETPSSRLFTNASAPATAWCSPRPAVAVRICLSCGPIAELQASRRVQLPLRWATTAITLVTRESWDDDHAVAVSTFRRVQLVEDTPAWSHIRTRSVILWLWSKRPTRTAVVRQRQRSLRRQRCWHQLRVWTAAA